MNIMHNKMVNFIMQLCHINQSISL